MAKTFLVVPELGKISFCDKYLLECLTRRYNSRHKARTVAESISKQYGIQVEVFESVLLLDTKTSCIVL